MKFIKSVTQWIQRQFANQYGKEPLVETKPNTPDLSGMDRAGSAYMKPVAAEPIVVPEPVVAAAPVSTTESVAHPYPSNPAPTHCEHEFFCAGCGLRLGEPAPSTVSAAPTASTQTVPDGVLLDDMRTDVPIRTREEIRELLKYETPDQTERRTRQERQDTVVESSIGNRRIVFDALAPCCRTEMSEAAPPVV